MSMKIPKSDFFIPVLRICLSCLILLVLLKYVGCSSRIAEMSKTAPIDGPDRESILRFILKHEAGLNTHEPAHVGGVSYAGITANAWTEWRDKQGDKAHLPANVIRLGGVNASQDPLTATDANLVVIKRFYHDYFERYHCWDVHPCLQAGYADFATLAGANATRVIQKLVNVKPDGIWKTHTTLAVKKFNDNIDMALEKEPDFAWKVFLKFDVRKREFLNSLAKQDPFYATALPGWLSRSNNLKALMKSYLLNNED